jgi:hypothetical protein
MKQLICILCTISLLPSAAFAISSADLAANPDVVEQKLALVEYAEEYMAEHPQLPTQNLTPDEEMDLIIECEKQNLSYEEKKSILNPVGIFQLDPSTSTSASAVPYSAQPSDMTLNAPYIYLSTTSYTWYVTMSGSWKSKDPWNVLHGVAKGKVGGLDRFGVSYFNTNGDNKCPARSSVRGWVDDGAAHEEVLENVVAESGSRGVGFEYQDARKVSGLTYYSLGKRFGCSIAYPSTFGSFHGIAQSFYVHTWNKTNITSFGFTGSTSGFGLNVSFDHAENSFAAGSGAQTAF